MERQVHTIRPVFDSNSKVLILGTFPSVKSREAAFFYGHPQNRFWAILAEVLGCPVPGTVENKKEMLLTHRIALWDVIARCDIRGSSDASIKSVKPNDLKPILDAAPITAVFTNGGTAHRLYNRYCFADTKRPDICLPSTSPANARFTIPMLVQSWSTVAKELKELNVPPRWGLNRLENHE